MDNKLIDSIDKIGATVGLYCGVDFILVNDWNQVEAINLLLQDGDIDDFEWGFTDEYSYCSDCLAIIRTAPDCYGWQPDFDDSEFGLLCSDCIDPDDYLEARVNANRLVNAYLVDPADYGWSILDLDFENGMHYGQNADPRSIIETLSNSNIDCLFTGSVGQFDVRFQVWVSAAYHDVATKILTTADTDLPYDQATEISKTLKGEHSDYYRMETHEVSQEDFIAGNFPK